MFKGLEFKTKDKAIKYIKKLSFKDIQYKCVRMRKMGKGWWVSYDI